MAITLGHQEAWGQVGFAVPSNSARPILEQLIRDGKVRRGALELNIQDLDTALAKSFGRAGREGALVTQVTKGGPAEQAGMREGDIILSFNGETVTGANHLKHLIAREKPATTRPSKFTGVPTPLICMPRWVSVRSRSQLPRRLRTQDKSLNH